MRIEKPSSKFNIKPFYEGFFLVTGLHESPMVASREKALRLSKGKSGTDSSGDVLFFPKNPNSKQIAKMMDNIKEGLAKKIHFINGIISIDDLLNMSDIKGREIKVSTHKYTKTKDKTGWFPMSSPAHSYILKIKPSGTDQVFDLDVGKAVFESKNAMEPTVIHIR